MSTAVTLRGPGGARPLSGGTVFGRPRDFLENQFVYVTVSPRARGFSVGVNMNPDKECNFDCAYCEVDRSGGGRVGLDVEVMAGELEATLVLAQSDGLRSRPPYDRLPDELRRLRHVVLSGDGEPTLNPLFLDAVQAVTHVRAKGRVPFFKLVLITNASHLDAPPVQAGLQLFTKLDEVWAKLDAGTQAYMERVNAAQLSLEKITANILTLARRRPVVIQSLFPMLDGAPPGDDEIAAYALRLRTLREAGAMIPLVQIYSATRPMAHPRCGHLPLRALTRIAQTVRQVAGLNAEVF